MTKWASVDRIDGITRQDFYGDYVAKGRPVVIRGMMSQWRALDWGVDYFRQHTSSVPLAVKKGNVAEGRRERVTLAGYTEALEAYEAGLQGGEPVEMPGYLHDVPLFRFFPDLVQDVRPFPLDLFPSWYRDNWPEYTQYFMGPTGSVTPLHFDTLLTNNLFFHLAGRKQFTLIPADQRKDCYTYGWRWARFDPTSPDYREFPQSTATTPVTVVLEPGEMLYMPPGTLHHVRNLSMTISFNIDWHTPGSALSGLASVLQGAPLKNGYYNALSFAGVGMGIPSRYVFPFYKSYLTYVS